MNVLDVLKKILELLKEAALSPVTGIAVIIGILFLIGKFVGSDEFSQRYTEPNFLYRSVSESKNESYDIEEYETEWNARYGNLVIMNQVVVKYDGEIILVINVKDYYDTNEAVLQNSRADDAMKSVFKFPVEKEQKMKLESFMEALKKLLQEKMDWSEEECSKLCEIYDIKLLALKYQSMYANQADDIYYLHSDEEIRILLTKEVKLRRADFVINLDDFDAEDSVYLNAELSVFAEECVNRIRAE